MLTTANTFSNFLQYTIKVITMCITYQHCHPYSLEELFSPLTLYLLETLNRSIIQVMQLTPTPTIIIIMTINKTFFYYIRLFFTCINNLLLHRLTE